MDNKQKISDYLYEKVPKKEVNSDKNLDPPKYGYGVRHIQLAIFLLCLTVNIIGRGHMGVTIVAMTSTQQQNIEIIVNSTTTGIRNNDTDIIENKFEYNKSIDKKMTLEDTDAIVYSWPKSVQEMVLNAFFLGYTIMMFPMGMVCQRYGGKLPLQISLIINAVVSIVTPWLTIWGGWKATCGCRILQGLSQAGTYPSVQALLAKWVPINERATLSCCVYTGLNIGTMIAFHIAGLLGASKWGWPSIFYTIGIICLICFILLTVFGAATPLEHKTITEEERNYIMGAKTEDSARKLKTPWRAMATSVPLWGTIISQIGGTIGFIFFFNQVPTYIHYILGVNVRNSGLLSSLPYVFSIFSTLGFGWLSDYFINHNILSRKNTRRICNSMSHCGIAFCLILTSYTYDTSLAVAYLVITLTLNMGGHTGWLINHIDLAPNFSGTLTAVGNTCANVFVLLIPVVISNVVTDVTNHFQWRILFFTIAGITIISNAVFLVLLSTDIQPWNYAYYNETTVDCPEGDNEKKEKHNRNKC